MPIIEIQSLSSPGVEVYSRLTDLQLRISPSSDRGIFIAESPKVIRVAVSAGYRPLSLLCEQRHITGDAADIIARFPDIPVYTGSRELLAQLTGYRLTRGVLAAMQRRERLSPEAICRGRRRVAIIYNVVDTTNIGSIFRSAATLGIEAVLLTPDSCDPLNRRAVRVSMGSVFLVPWTWCADPIAVLHSLGFRVAAMALSPDAVALGSPHDGADSPQLAIMLGTEGDGLPAAAIARADYVVRIPMAAGVDSLNVGSASAVAFWEYVARSRSKKS